MIPEPRKRVYAVRPHSALSALLGIAHVPTPPAPTNRIASLKRKPVWLRARERWSSASGQVVGGPIMRRERQDSDIPEESPW